MGALLCECVHVHVHVAAWATYGLQAVSAQLCDPSAGGTNSSNSSTYRDGLDVWVLNQTHGLSRPYKAPCQQA
jgi:hypothetical protein